MYGIGSMYDWVEESEQTKKEKFDIVPYKNRIFLIPNSFTTWAVHDVWPNMDYLTLVNILDKTDTKEVTIFYFFSFAQEKYF